MFSVLMWGCSSDRGFRAGQLFELALDGNDRHARVEPRELRETDIRQRFADGGIEPLPRAADLAAVLEATISTAHGTIRERDGSFQCVEDGRGADRVRRTGQLVAAARSARGIDQPGAMQLFE